MRRESERKGGARWTVLAALSLVLVGVVGGVGYASLNDPLDPARNLALPCEVVSTPGQPPRAARNLVHVANVCGFVGTDIEFQSRTDAGGNVRDYAFVGTMGAGTRIFEITDPARPRAAGGYTDPGWQNDVSLRGDVMVVAFDWLVVGPHVSTCLKEKDPAQSLQRGGFDVVQLQYDPASGDFRTETVGCYLSQIDTGGTHTITIHPSGRWISSNSAFAGIEVVDATTLQRVRHIPVSIVDDAHDVSFSAEGNTLYSAGIDSTRIVDVSDIFNRAPTLVGTVPNAATAAQGADGHTIAISHQSDTSADGQLFVVTDEAGGGLSETRCNEDPNGKIGGAHIWALAPLDGVAGSAGASPSTPKKLGTWIYPNPTLLSDAIGRTERACTIHVFRNGGNGSAGPGPIAAGFDGVSRLSTRELVAAHYGAGVWHIDFSGPPSSADGIAEEPRTTWGNTLGWSVMPGADTWSAKEYKGFVYTGDMGRGFDVYGFTRCTNAGCLGVPANTPGRAGGGGQLENQLAELLILRGTSAGGRANFGLDVEYVAGRPSGSLTYNDKAAGQKLAATLIDTFVIGPTGRSATVTGTGTVNGAGEIPFVVEVEDLGEPGSADTFTITFRDYVAAGVLAKGNVQVTSGSD
jgi:hypothetical protein